MNNHHVCGVGELDDAPIEFAARVVSIVPPNRDSPLLRTMQELGRPLLVLHFDDVIHAEEGARLPTEEHIRELLAFDAGADPDDRLVIHCSAGVSRSTAALVILLSQRHPGQEHEIFATLRRLRPKAWPNSLMIAIADRILDRRGKLIEALRAHSAVQVQLYPSLAREMISIGRESEVPIEQDDSQRLRRRSDV